MSELDYLRAVLLGVIQGLTEFLPISSSGHLALTQRWFDLDPGDQHMLLFDILAHVGTLIAVVIVFAAPARRFIGRLMREAGEGRPGKRHAWFIALLAVVACLPTAAIGLGFKDTFEAAFDKPLLIGLGLIVTGALLAVTRVLPRQRRGWRRFLWWQALLVGVAQAVAILPGISRSGSTICVALCCGLRRRWATEFSFLIALPAIVGGALLKIRETADLPSGQLAAEEWGPVLAGSAVSLVVGVFALRMLVDVVRRAKLHYFAIYCWVLGALVVAGVL